MAGPRLFGRAADAPGAEVQEPAGSDGEVAPGAGATLHELAGQPFAEGQGGLAFDEDCVAAYRGWDPVGRAGRGIPGYGQAPCGCSQLAAQCRSALAHAGGVPLNVVSQWLGHANVQVTLRVYLPIVGADYGMEGVP